MQRLAILFPFLAALVVAVATEVATEYAGYAAGEAVVGVSPIHRVAEIPVGYRLPSLTSGYRGRRLDPVDLARGALFGVLILAATINVAGTRPERRVARGKVFAGAVLLLCGGGFALTPTPITIGLGLGLIAAGSLLISSGARASAATPGDSKG